MTEEKTFAAGLGIEAYTAEELGATSSTTAPEIPEAMMEAYQIDTDNLKNAVAERVAANILKGTGEGIEFGTRFGLYEVVDIMTISPWKPGVFSPFVNLPHKLVANNEWILHRALLFINPLPGPGSTPTGQMQLGGHGYRITFNLMNVTTGNPVMPTFAWIGTFGPLAPVLSVWPYWIPPPHPTPGGNPQLFELNVTFDCTDAAQPYAAFSTQWWDIDFDPGWPFPDPGGLRRLLPLRYLVHPE